MQMNQTITTRYFAPGHVRGARYKATASGGKSVTIHQSIELSDVENHIAAARALCVLLKWHGDFIAGEAGLCPFKMVHVFVQKPHWSI